MAALEPPGNLARELALYRRRIFAATGETSALAFPELMPLAIGCAPRARSLRLSPTNREHLLDSAWEGVRGRFRFGLPSLRSGSLYLGLEGPVEALAEACRDILGKVGFEPCPQPLLDCGIGFFVCRQWSGVAPAEAAELRPPSGSFEDAQLVLLRFDCGIEPFAAQSWKELGRSRRLTGPPRRGERRG